METKRTKFLAEVRDKEGQELSISFLILTRSLDDAKKYLESKGYQVTKVVFAKDHHICKYCGSIAESSYEDLLCEECRQCFGHSLYSEL